MIMIKLTYLTSLCCLVAFICTTASTATPAAKPIVVTPADAPTIKKAIAGKIGHVVVVNFWATWCGPCVEEFPALVTLQNQYRRVGVVVIAVSADDRKDITSKVKPFLIQQKAYFPQFLEHAYDPEDFINAFDPKWQGDLPRTFIYDKRGHLVKELAGEQTEKNFEEAVKPLLNNTTSLSSH
jgi:thiol-disulfide isomerase/thioredoxin